MVTICWQAPECDGGKKVLGYWVEYRKSIESSWKKCNKQRLKENEFTIVGLAEATEYEFRVLAENETGMSRPRRTATCIKTKLSGKYNQIYFNSYCIYFHFICFHCATLMIVTDVILFAVQLSVNLV